MFVYRSFAIFSSRSRFQSGILCDKYKQFLFGLKVARRAHVRTIEKHNNKEFPLKKLIFAFLIIFASSVFAQGVRPAQFVSFADIKSACQNPVQFHNQVAPSNLQISCRDVQTRWVADAEGMIPTQSSRTATVSVISDKYTVSPVVTVMPLAQQATMACPRFKEVTESVETVRAVTCDDVVAMTGSETDFCNAAIDELKSANPESIVTADTGKTMDYCQLVPPVQVLK